jgi:hypothetical protein
MLPMQKLLTVSSLCLCTLFLLAVLPAMAQIAQQPPPEPEKINFPTVGISLGQTARLHLVNLGLAGPGTIPPGPCRAQMGFLDSAGNLLAPMSQLSLAPGQAGFVDLNRDALTGFTGFANLRVQSRATISFVAPPDPDIPPGPCDNMHANLEVIDNLTARTSVLVDNPRLTPPPDPEQPPGPPIRQFGMLGITFGQTARVSVTNLAPATSTDPNGLPPGPCTAEITFLDSQGNTLLPAVRTDVVSGQTVFADLNRNTLLGTGDFRVQSRATISFEPPPDPDAPPGPCAGMLAGEEVINNLTGRTTISWTPPGPPVVPSATTTSSTTPQ